jgi:hypothetical protein
MLVLYAMIRTCSSFWRVEKRDSEFRRVSIASAAKVLLSAFFECTHMRSPGRDFNKFSRPLRAVPNRSRVDLGAVSMWRRSCIVEAA